jgi:predicted acetyltransferase
MIRLQTVRNEDRELFWNINQKYLYEMTLYYPDEMDGQGNYHYGYFDAYFTDPERSARFIFDDDTLVGFVMLNPYSAIDHRPDHTIAEFTIFPSYRRKHYALDAARRILAEHPGKWEIKYNEKNFGAKKLWTMVAAPYSPTVYRLNEEETVLEFVNERTAD